MRARPMIVVAADRPAELDELTAALGRRFGADCEILATGSPSNALEVLERARAQGDEAALVLADETMTEMAGSEVLARARDIHPSARRGLLVAWRDRKASATVLEGCAFGKLDNYITKPWHPPELYLYPVVGEFLAEWTRAYGPRMELVRVVGVEPSPRAYELRELLERNAVPYGFYALSSPEGQRMLESAGLTPRSLPVVIMLDGSALSNPSNAEMIDALGATGEVTERHCDIAIVGGGPAGLAAAVYAASEGLRTVVSEREVVGGRAGTSSLIATTAVSHEEFAGSSSPGGPMSRPGCSGPSS